MPDNGKSFSIEGEKNGNITLFLRGRIGLADFAGLFSEIKTLFVELNPLKLAVDLTHVKYFDSSGALFLVQLEEEALARSVPFTILNVSAQQNQILSIVDREALRAPSLAKGAFAQSRGRTRKRNGRHTQGCL